MKKKVGLIVLVVVLGALIIGASALYNKLSGEQEQDKLVTQGTNDATHEKETIDGSTVTEESNSAEQDNTIDEYNKAPDFTVLDSDGNSVKLSDFQGKPVILNFWASWCGPCKSEMPDFDEAYAEYGGDIHFVMVNLTDGMRETMDGAKSFIEGEGYSFPIYFDTETEAAIAYGAYSIPVTYFIDAEGNLIAQGMGALDRATLQQGIDMILP